MERRGQPRVRPEGCISVRILCLGRLDTGTLMDLNNVGAFVATSLKLEKGERIHIELDIPGAEPRPLEALVARCSEEISDRDRAVPAGLGLVFVASTLEERQLIQQVVMSTLTLDLLSFGYDHRTRLLTRAKTHPHVYVPGHLGQVSALRRSSPKSSR